LLIGSEIGGDLDIEEAELDCYYAPSGLSAERATVTQAFIWKNIKRNKSTIVMLDMGNA
jgi:hypothetical protein